jgi:hypothetical protein
LPAMAEPSGFQSPTKLALVRLLAVTFFSTEDGLDVAAVAAQPLHLGVVAYLTSLSWPVAKGLPPW